MDDDLDDLLDEVEAKYVNNSRPNKSTLRSKSANNSQSNQFESVGVAVSATASSTSTSTSHKKNHRSRHGRHKDEELNAFIDDICDIPDPLEPEKISSSAVSPIGDGKRRCFPVYIAGSITTTGLGSSANQRACNKLRCTDCDFKISIFDDFKWNSTTDYLFLRNNMPDFSRLKTNLAPSPGWRAYACQCKWKNVAKIVDVKMEKDLKWVCGKH